jgi:hypothetical protein
VVKKKKSKKKSIKKSKKKPIHMMDIPVGGLTYHLYACPAGLGETKEFKRLGNCDYETHTIQLNIAPEVSNEEISYVLFHELIHAAVEAATCTARVNPHSEIFVHPFARILWGALQHSGLINNWWKKQTSGNGTRRICRSHCSR